MSVTFRSLLATRAMWHGYCSGVETAQDLIAHHGPGAAQAEYAAAVARLAEVDAQIEAEIGRMGDRWSADRLAGSA